MGQGGGGTATGSSSHYGVLGTCQTALAYYEAAANGVMDELESGPTKGKVVSRMCVSLICLPIISSNLTAYTTYVTHFLTSNPKRIHQLTSTV